MANSSVSEQKHQRTPETLHAAQSKVPTPISEATVQRTIKEEVLSKKRSEARYHGRERQVDGRHQMEIKRDNILLRKDELKHNVSKLPELSNNKYKPRPYREDTIQKGEDHDNHFQRREQKSDRNSSHGKRLESADSLHQLGRHRQENASERDLFKTSSPQKPEQWPASNGISSPIFVNNEPAEKIHVRSMRKMKEDAADRLKSNFGGVPPPYVKPRKSKHKVDAEENDTLTFNPPGNSNRPEKPPRTPDFPDAHENVDGMGSFTEIYYKNESGVTSNPRRRSHRRKHSRSASTQDAVEVETEERVARRVSTSRRKHESRKGLQVLFDDDHYQKDDTERMIDKLLLHYSKKPSSSDPGKPRETKNRTNDAMKSPIRKAAVVTNMGEEDSTPRKETSRSMSFPPRQVTQSEPSKVFTRAVSFQQETPAKHVHPKLPDYDDLAARFAALRANKG